MPTKVMLHKKSSKQYTNLAVVQELYAHTGELAGRLVSCLVSFPTVCLDAMSSRLAGELYVPPKLSAAVEAAAL